MPDRSPDEPRSRRDLIVVAALAFAGVGVVATAWPMLSSLAPDRGAPPPDAATLDISKIAEGDTVVMIWRGQPIAVRHRARTEIEAARRVRVDARDRLARNQALAKDAIATDANRTKPDHPQWLVVAAVCTNENCVVRAMDVAERIADGIGWFCPCCASRYDLSGRVISGPAPTNLVVPPYVLRGSELRVG